MRRLIVVPLFASGLLLRGRFGVEGDQTVTVINTVADSTYVHTNEDGSVETLHVTGSTVTATLQRPETEER